MLQADDRGSTDDERPMTNADVLRAAFAAASRRDAAGQLAHYTDDAVIEVALATPPGRYEGAEALGRLMAYAYENFPIELTIDDVIECADPDQLVVEYHALGTVVATGKTFEKRYLARFEFRDGKIARQREFFDPQAMAAAMQPDPEG
jgi:ketosteroid isomerase-like protein